MIKQHEKKVCTDGNQVDATEVFCYVKPEIKMDSEFVTP